MPSDEAGKPGDISYSVIEPSCETKECDEQTFHFYFVHPRKVGDSWQVTDRTNEDPF